MADGVSADDRPGEGSPQEETFFQKVLAHTDIELILPLVLILVVTLAIWGFIYVAGTFVEFVLLTVLVIFLLVIIRRSLASRSRF